MIFMFVSKTVSHVFSNVLSENISCSVMGRPPFTKCDVGFFTGTIGLARMHIDVSTSWSLRGASLSEPLCQVRKKVE